MTFMELTALEDESMQRIDLGGASASTSPDSNARYRVLVHALFWGQWKGKKIRVVATSHPTARVYEDVTVAAAIAYLRQHPDDTDVRVVTGNIKTNTSRPIQPSRRAQAEFTDVIDVDFEIVPLDEKRK